MNARSVNGWAEIKVGDVLTLRNGRAFKSSEWKTSGRPIVRIQNLKSADAPFNYYDGDLPEQFAVREGDLLFAWSGTPGTSFGAHIWHGPDAWLNQHIFRVDFPPDQFDRDFLAYALNRNVAFYIEQAQGGVGLAHITKAKLNASALPMPPLEEQRRIAAYLHQIEARRAAVTTHVTAARATVARLRAAVLAAACTGRLTEDWRQEHDSQGCRWPVMTMAKACARVQSGTTPKKWHDGPAGGVPFLKVYNIVDQQIDFNYKPQFIAADLHEGSMRRACALPGDVLMNIVGPPLGKVAVVNNDYQEWSINQALTLFRPSDRVTSGWLYIFLCSGASVRSVLNQTRGQVGQVNISLTQCREFEIPVPPIDEQNEIVRRATAALEAVDLLAVNISAAETALGRAGRSALAKAFGP